mmetsp:Transcript_49712/g.103421  ORF Transcript_49712/g.103421 Transcript_49712/m.103421 type:complete len:615 (-) Transcript_49712:45-1889(-)
MDAVVSRVRLRLEPEVAPVLVDEATQGAGRGRSRVRRPEELASEVLPLHLVRRPLHLVVVDACSGRGELGAHVHVEAVDDVDAVNLAAVEAAAELDDGLAFLERIVLLAQLIGADSQLLGSVHGVEDQAIFHHLAPCHAELLLELRLSLVLNGEFRRLLHDSLGGDGAVVDVDELLLVNDFGLDRALALDGQAAFRELVLHESLHLVGHSMGLDEHEGCVRLRAGLHDLSVQALPGGLHDDVGDPVRVAVGRRAAVLHVTTASLLGIAGDADGSTAVCDSVLEVSDGAGLVLACEALLITFSVLGNVLGGNLAEGLANLYDELVAAFLTHGRDRKVRVAAGAIPVALHWLGRERADTVVALGDAQHNVARNGEMISHLHTPARTNLKLPLARHDLCVDTGDFNASLQALHVVLLRDGPANGNAAACTGVVGSLRRWLRAILVEAQRNLCFLSDLPGPHQGVLLLDAKPRIQMFVLLHDLRTRGTRVANCRLTIPGIVGFGQHQDMGTSAERILEDRLGVEVDLRVVAVCLLRAAAVIVPHTKPFHGSRQRRHGHRLGPRNLLGIQPDVLRQDRTGIAGHVGQAISSLVHALLRLLLAGATPCSCWPLLWSHADC